MHKCNYAATYMPFRFKSILKTGFPVWENSLMLYKYYSETFLKYQCQKGMYVFDNATWNFENMLVLKVSKAKEKKICIISELWSREIEYHIFSTVIILHVCRLRENSLLKISFL